MKIFIDPGHGGKDPGAVWENLKESDLVLDIALQIKLFLEHLRLQDYLSRKNLLECRLSRHTTIADVSLPERTKLSNELGSDIFISLHINAAKNIKATGVETYHFIDSLLGRKLAKSIHKRLISTFRDVFKDRGIKENKTFFVLKHTQCPAVLLELGFLTNRNDRILLSSSFSNLLMTN